LSKQKKLLMWTVWVVSLIQMLNTALSPAMNLMKTVVFSQYPLSTIQTVMSLSGLVSPFVALLSADLIRRGFVTKRSVVLTGLFTLGLTGLLSLILNRELWQVGILTVLAGISSGCYMSTVLSIIMDRFTPDERQMVTGVQSVFVNIGGFLISLLGGLLASWRWHGGFLIFLVGIPIGVMAVMTLPKEQRVRRAGKKETESKARFDPNIFFYAATVFVFMLMFAVLNVNLAIHLGNSGFNNPAVAGIITSVQMAGGMAFGFIFSKLTRALNDKLIFIAYFMLFVSFSMLNLFHASLILMGVGVFFAGASLSLIGPHCIVAVSHCVEARTSALATSLIIGIAPGLGSFLSPMLFTNLTTALAGEGSPGLTNFRYQFVAFTALALGVLLTIYMGFREKRKKIMAQAQNA
jgi:MFS family permease